MTSHNAREPVEAIPEGLVNAVARFDAACRDWGWQEDQGHVGTDMQASMLEHSAAGDALMAAIAAAIHDAVMAERDRCASVADWYSQASVHAEWTEEARGAGYYACADVARDIRFPQPIKEPSAQVFAASDDLPF